MPLDQTTLPLIGREATVVVQPQTVPEAERIIEVIWTTGARVQRARWEGWDDLVEYDEELEVTPKAVRIDRLNTVGVFLDSHRGGGSIANALGSVVPGSVKISGGQGRATIRLTSAPDAAPAIARILDGTIRTVSVGYRVHTFEIERRPGQRELRRAVDWEPFEISAVAIAADAGAQMRDGGQPERLAPCAIRHVEAAAPAASRKVIAMEQDEALAPAQTRGAETIPAAPPVNVEEIRAAANRAAGEILGLCQRHGVADRAADMIARGISMDAARAEILDALAAGHQAAASAEPIPAQARRQPDTAFRDAMSEAIAFRANPNGRPAPVAGREFVGRSMLEMGRMALERDGINTSGMSRMDLAGAALGVRSGIGYHGTGDFPEILGNTINRTLRAAYDSTPRTFTAWARQATLSDLRTVKRVQLGGAPDLLEVPEHGEFTYGTMGEGVESYSPKTYGRIIAFTRQMLVNDDLSAFDRVPTAFGAAAADLESDIVYGILTANAAMSDSVALFHATHGNLAGTGTIINEAALTAVYLAFGSQTGIEGRKISLEPKYLIVPPGLRLTEARKNMTSTTPAAVADVNAHAGQLQIIAEPRLIPASGQAPWYVAADPSRIDTIEYAYLEGNSGVHTETRVGFEVDGIEVKARHDFAAKAIDYRGLYKNAGAAS